MPGWFMTFYFSLQECDYVNNTNSLLYTGDHYAVDPDSDPDRRNIYGRLSP